MKYQQVSTNENGEPSTLTERTRTLIRKWRKQYNQYLVNLHISLLEDIERIEEDRGRIQEDRRRIEEDIKRRDREHKRRMEESDRRMYQIIKGIARSKNE